MSFIIVHYNVADLLRNCINSILIYSHNVDYEIIVVDNNSPDNSWKVLKNEFPQVKFIENKENSGFAKANNLAVKIATKEFLYILNPDTELEGNYLNEILNFASSKANFGCLGLRMHDKNGNFLPESKRSVPDMFNSFEKLFNNFKSNHSKSYYRNDISENEIAEVEVVTGANLLIKKSVYEVIGGFDETYFMYGEDIDLCYTLLRNGYRNFYYGKYAILHYKGESTIKDSKYLERFYGAMEIFVKKYYSKNPLQLSFLLAGLKLRHRLAKLKLKTK